MAGALVVVAAAVAVVVFAFVLFVIVGADVARKNLGNVTGGMPFSGMIALHVGHLFDRSNHFKRHTK